MLKKVIGIVLLLSISSPFLTACSHVAGNIIPNDGPTMESIYDDSGDPMASANREGTMHFFEEAPSLKAHQGAVLLSRSTLSAQVMGSPAFSVLDNPELKLYIFPHLAGTEMLPIPGYWTAFPAYPRHYYALPLMETNQATEIESLHS
jgi:conjugative transfer region lipoprotein (TIGR03751 family)